MKGDKMSNRSSLGTMVRRTLSDITNTLPHSKSPVILENLPQDAVSTKELIDNLVKEKMALVKHIQEKNKIIELAGVEIQNMRACFQKMQLQNWSLAQANSRMLAELNMGKERLKTLQHELGCKEAILKTKNLQLKKQAKINIHENELVIAEELDLKESAVVAREPRHDKDSKPCNARRRGCPLRSRSLGGTVISQLDSEKEVLGSKRRCVRRQSAASRIQHQEPTEDLFEITDTKLLVSKQNNAINDSSTKLEVSCGSQLEEEESRRRTSITGRPTRKAAEKVHSYKEKHVNVKMRRPE